MIYKVITDLEQPLVPVRGRVVTISLRLLGLLQSGGGPAPLTRALGDRRRWGSFLRHPCHFTLKHFLELLCHSDDIVLRLVVFVAVLENTQNVELKLNSICVLPKNKTSVICKS